MHRFAVVGAANAVLDLAVFNLLLLTHPTRSAPILVVYNTIAVLAALGNSYVWNSRWTFRGRMTAGVRRWRERALFGVQGGVNLGINDLVILLGSLLLGPGGASVPSPVGTDAVKVVAMLAASAASYLLMRHVVFHPPPR